MHTPPDKDSPKERPEEQTPEMRNALGDPPAGQSSTVKPPWVGLALAAVAALVWNNADQIKAYVDHQFSGSSNAAASSGDSTADFARAKEAYYRDDYKTALALFRPLAEAGHADAEHAMGELYFYGDGVPQDYAESFKWTSLSAEHGFAKAQSNLGLMYESGQGTKQDYAMALSWFQKAAAQGNKEAQNNIGIIYAQGNGVTQDYAEAAKWDRLAADQGFAQAQHDLGIFYAKGQGVAQDDAEAFFWLSLAAADKRYIPARDDAAKKLDAEKIDSVNARVRDWKPQTTTDKPQTNDWH